MAGGTRGIKTQFFIVKSRTEEQACCHPDLTSEMGLMLQDGMSDEVCERG